MRSSSSSSLPIKPAKPISKKKVFRVTLGLICLIAAVALTGIGFSNAEEDPVTKKRIIHIKYWGSAFVLFLIGAVLLKAWELVQFFGM